VLGPWTNPGWLKALASAIVGVLILLSLILTINTIFPSINVTTLAEDGAVIVGVVLLLMGASALRSRPGSTVSVTFMEAGPEVPKEQWTMPPATLLSRPQFSGTRRLAMLGLGGYMVIALVMLIVKSVQLATG
jgi:hypothetical protein